MGDKLSPDSYLKPARLGKFRLVPIGFLKETFQLEWHLMQFGSGLLDVEDQTVCSTGSLSSMDPFHILHFLPNDSEQDVSESLEACTGYQI